MAWCRQATSHYLSQCWPRSMSPNGVTRPQWVNSMRHSDVYLHQQSKPLLVQIMACCLFSAKPLSEPMLVILIWPIGINFTEILIKIQCFHSRKWIRQCCLHSGPFVSISMRWYIIIWQQWRLFHDLCVQRESLCMVRWSLYWNGPLKIDLTAV